MFKLARKVFVHNLFFFFNYFEFIRAYVRWQIAKGLGRGCKDLFITIQRRFRPQ